ncbi:VAMP-associated protein [Laetiporus sulphureus 93-53]|uniref:VAMP-associated protein n=1 Tax=Laetiporus sulphureus 93-53 TaxID=1314785 RepID=A0A165HLY8_9APHY|nr:VAMP-associated protein [Laetiporus sulphureus 93-53]KZT11906.1 VAMP-associated protein [Laetiporus sulphureus 93-53]
MSVQLSPSVTLGFHRPLTQHVKQSLAITNPNAQPVAFKVKTTAPKVYCVRPNSGRVEPGETVEVQVMLQAMKEEPPLNIKCKDKFLIQSTTITHDKETMPVQDIWNENSEEVHSQKIRVAYLPPEGQTVPEEDEGPASHGIENVGDIFNYGTVRTHPSSNGDAQREHSGDSGVQPHEEEQHHDASSTPPQPTIHVQDEQSAPEAPESDVGIVNVNVLTPQPPALSSSAPAPAPNKNADLQARLREAQAEIERLRNLISSMPEPSTAPTTLSTTSTELRRRRPLSTTDAGSTLDGETEVGTYIEEAVAPPEGVPLQVVIVIALGVFITTYLFF